MQGGTSRSPLDVTTDASPGEALPGTDVAGLYPFDAGAEGVWGRGGRFAPADLDWGRTLAAALNKLRRQNPSWTYQHLVAAEGPIFPYYERLYIRENGELGGQRKPGIASGRMHLRLSTCLMQEATRSMRAWSGAQRSLRTSWVGGPQLATAHGRGMHFLARAP
jgi:hypothetical protein